MAAAVLVAPAAASARVVQAVTILPPGQSGVPLQNRGTFEPAVELGR